MFHVGQKVVLVGGEHPAGARVVNQGHTAKIGGVYTIREIDPRYIAGHGFAGIRLVERIATPVNWGGGMIEPAFPATWFRPVHERKTSIEIFTRMLTPKRVSENV